MRGRRRRRRRRSRCSTPRSGSIPTADGCGRRCRRRRRGLAAADRLRGRRRGDGPDPALPGRRLLWQAEFPNARTRYTMKSVRTVRNLLQLGQAQQRPAVGAGPRVRPCRQSGGPASLGEGRRRMPRRRGGGRSLTCCACSAARILSNGHLGGERAPGRADDSAGHGGATARRHLHRHSGDPRPGELRSRRRFTHGIENWGHRTA